MTAFKMAGCLCVLTASALAGISFSAMFKRRWQFWQEMYEMLLFLEQEMLRHHALLSEALGSAADHCKSDAKGLFEYAAQKVGDQERLAFSQIWSEAVCRLPEGLLPEQEDTLLLDLADVLCCSDSITQKVLFGKYQDRFLALHKEAETAYRDKGRLCRALSAAGGAFVILLFL